MRQAVHCRSANRPTASPAGSARRAARQWLRHPGAALSAAVVAFAGTSALAQGFGFGQQAATASFKSAPVPTTGAEADAASDTILGVVPANTLFFITAAVIAVFWFTVGGGRRARVGREGH